MVVGFYLIIACCCLVQINAGEAQFIFPRVGEPVPMLVHFGAHPVPLILASKMAITLSGDETRTCGPWMVACWFPKNRPERGSPEDKHTGVAAKALSSRTSGQPRPISRPNIGILMAKRRLSTLSPFLPTKTNSFKGSSCLQSGARTNAQMHLLQAYIATYHPLYSSPQSDCSIVCGNCALSWEATRQWISPRASTAYEPSYTALPQLLATEW